MKDIIKMVSEIEGNIETSKIYIEDLFLTGLFYLTKYNEITKYVAKLEKACKTTKEKKEYLQYWKFIFLSERKVCKKILNNIKKNCCSFIGLEVYEGEAGQRRLEERLNIFFRVYDEQKSVMDNFVDFAIANIESRIWRINNSIHLLEEHPSIFYNTEENYVGNNFRLKYGSDIIKYKDVDIRAGRLHSYVLFSNEDSAASTKRALLNILAFYDCEPYYYMTDNGSYNQKLEILYEQFDILDTVKLRKKKFLETNLDEPINLEKSILKSKMDLVNFTDLEHEEILDLYHSSLKQVEPLPRCVFLYRVFEYGASQHYKKIFNYKQYKPEDALDYYINEAIKYNFNPIYFIDYGRYISSSSGEVLKKKKPQLRNFITVIKSESKQVFSEWSVDKYLKNKNGPGDIVYSTGRNLVAHGGNGIRNMKYDYGRNYKHINDVNIVLELVARYLVENLNPSLKNRVERRKEYYIQGKYSSLFKEDI